MKRNNSESLNATQEAYGASACGLHCLIPLVLLAGEGKRKAIMIADADDDDDDIQITGEVPCPRLSPPPLGRSVVLVLT